MHGHVQAGVAHNRVAVGETAGVAQLGQDVGAISIPIP
jgi:hypothetical protein